MFTILLGTSLLGGLNLPLSPDLNRIENIYQNLVGTSPNVPMRMRVDAQGRRNQSKCGWAKGKYEICD